jgi:tetratricopeptide (TPR) repeat protein
MAGHTVKLPPAGFVDIASPQGHCFGHVHNYTTGKNPSRWKGTRRVARNSGKQTVAELLEAARAEHQAGRLDTADRLYRQILRNQPEHPVAAHLAGVVALQRGNPEQALLLIRRALKVQPAYPEALNNLATALKSVGQLEEALSACHRALELRPSFAEAQSNRGNLLKALGRIEEAAQAYDQALSLRPGFLEARRNRALLDEEQGRLERAAAGWAVVVAACPGDSLLRRRWAGTMLRLGAEAFAQQDFEEALAWFAQTIDCLDGGSLGGDLGSGLETCPEKREALLGQSEVWRALERLPEALIAGESALRLAGESACEFRSKVLVNLSILRRDMGQPEAALEACCQALLLTPELVEAHNNQGNLLRELGRLEEARAAFDKASALNPDDPEIRLNRGLVDLAWGRNLSGGWADYEARLETIQQRNTCRQPGCAPWRGEDLTGRNLLIWREQGLGDELLFASQYAWAIARAERCVIECDSRLLGLFQRSFPAAECRPVPPEGAGNVPVAPLAGKAAGKPIDFHVPAGSLAAFSQGCFVPTAGWLRPDPALAKRWDARLSSTFQEETFRGVRVGLCWRSRWLNARRQGDYTMLKAWFPLLTLPGLNVVSLQMPRRSPSAKRKTGLEPPDPRMQEELEQELKTVEKTYGVRLHRWPWLDLRDDLESTAAMISNLDLVISAPTAIAELAGALGVPVWRTDGAGGWTQLGTACRPWFPSMRVFRVGCRGIATVPSEMAAALKKLVPGFGTQGGG